MYTTIVAVAGAIIGILLASSQVPRIRVLPMVGIMVMTAGGITAELIHGNLTFVHGITLIVGTLTGFGSYSVFLWSRSGIVADSSVQLLVRSIFRPAYLRGVYRSQKLAQNQSSMKEEVDSG